MNRLEGINVIHLRPGFLMENLLFNLDMIANMGINGTPIAPSLPISMIATKDIAAVAARLMEESSFEGKLAREPLGPREVTMIEATKVLGTAIGKKDLQYMQFPYVDALQAMLGLGISASVAGEMIEMYRGMNEGQAQQREIRSPENTTPTTLEEFAETFAAIYRANAVAKGEAHV